MKIIIMRHGQASTFAQSDAQRPLTAEGLAKALQQGQLLHQQGEIHKVLVSPYLRAQETFKQVNQAFGQQLTDKMETWSALTPYGEAKLVADYLHVLYQENPNQRVLIISHIPMVNDLVQEFTHNLAYFSFYPASFAYLEWQGDKGQVLDFYEA